jgi:hypothetical protein
MKQIPEDILIKALELREEGKSAEHIFAAFSEWKDELQSYFNLTEDLRAEAASITPPSKEVLLGALRRAAAMEEISALPIRNATYKFFERVPFSLRVLTPILAVLFIVAFVDRSRVAAPGPVVNQTSTPGVTETTEIMSVAQDTDSGANSAALMAKAPAPEQPPTAPAATMMAAKSAAPTAPAAEQGTPSEEADKIAQAYMADADSEAAVMSDTSTEEQAAQADESQSAQYVSEPTN